MRRIKKPKEDPELNITSFMNLMIVLVPVLLLNMVFSQTMVLNIKLPVSANSNSSKPLKEVYNLGVRVYADSFLVTYNDKPLKKIKKKNEQYDYTALSAFLQPLKLTVEEKMNAKNKEGEEYKYKTDITASFLDNADYQVVIQTMDTLRSYPTVVVVSVVHAVLFPDIFMGGITEKNSQSPVVGGAK